MVCPPSCPDGLGRGGIFLGNRLLALHGDLCHRCYGLYSLGLLVSGQRVAHCHWVEFFLFSYFLLCVFLTSLHDEGLSVTTVKGYRAALNTVFKAAGNLHLVSDCRVTDLMKAFGIERPITRRLFPAWDLPLVLRSLRIAPYEPLHTALLQDITKRLFFYWLLHRASVVESWLLSSAIPSTCSSPEIIVR